MSYIDLNEYNRKWIFTHQSMPVEESDLELIKPMSQARSAQFWKENISSSSPDADRLAKEDWPRNSKNWSEEVDWMHCWESDDEALPELVLEHIQWQDDVTVYFCYEKYNVIETKWSVFKRNWKNFLFFDDGPILVGRRRGEALWFNSGGTVKLGNRK
ncbi:DUF2947 domain-containing protein [Vibrio sp. JC009]|uniref:DUF2947 domain-containing protein n=1 Tax=Vibrio sp. JC009 TaxID=2912314 RepID=UPI0023B0F649|nr:DUF2947 domain-containing protein [Vibrio sp. JC009]WED20555.1 DUF2947 domain-containing protein [Vibrio sp. JC009]